MPIRDIRKQLYKFQEGLVVLGLTQMLPKGTTACWNYDKSHTPAGMSIDPDIIVRTSSGIVSVWFVCTTGAELAGQKKFWRTIAEVLEAMSLEDRPRCFNVIDGNIKPRLISAYRQAFDGICHLSEEVPEASVDIMSWAQRHGNKTPIECMAVLEAEAPRRRWWPGFCNVLTRLLRERPCALHSLISSYSTVSGTATREKATTLRRSLAQFVALTPVQRVKALRSESLPAGEPIEHLLALGIVVRTLRGARISNGPLLKFLKNTPKSKLDYLVEYVETKGDSFMGYVSDLRGVGSLGGCYNWILDHFDELKSPIAFARVSQMIFGDPAAPFSASGAIQQVPNNNWLLYSVINVLRCESGRKDGYGYTEIARETEIRNVHLKLEPYINRTRDIDKVTLDSVAGVLAGHLVRIGNGKFKELIKPAIQTQTESIFNFQMMNYRHFNPIEWLVLRDLERAGIPCSFPAALPSFVVDEGVAATTGNLIQIGDRSIWIKCQSAYAGRIDKRKELAGRVGAIRLAMSGTQQKEAKFYLVIDGDFDQQDIDLLARSGWNAVVYFDEFDRILRLIT